MLAIPTKCFCSFFVNFPFLYEEVDEAHYSLARGFLIEAMIDDRG